MVDAVIAVPRISEEISRLEASRSKSLEKPTDKAPGSTEDESPLMRNWMPKPCWP